MTLQRSRLGGFFFLIGLVMLVVFFASDQSQDPQFLLFFGGVILTSLGGFIFWRYRSAPAPSGRFNLMRKINEGRKSPKKKKK